MGKNRGGVQNKAKKRIAHLKWLLYTNTPPPEWSKAQKLQAELDHYVEYLEQKKNHHSGSLRKTNKIINN